MMKEESNRSYVPFIAIVAVVAIVAIVVLVAHGKTQTISLPDTTMNAETSASDDATLAGEATKPPTTPLSCTETDSTTLNNPNYYQPGTTTMTYLDVKGDQRTQSGTDKCLSATKLDEYYCGNLKILSHKPYTCPYGCDPAQGVCQPQPCTPGAVVITCSTTPGTFPVEYQCNSNGIGYHTSATSPTSCPSGTTCHVKSGTAGVCQ